MACAARANPAVAQALDCAFARVVRAPLTAFADTASADPETLYSLEPADCEAARQEVIRALLPARGELRYSCHPDHFSPTQFKNL